ncbi:hypothetical protein MFU01_51070 [Myxococcus fulvus]|uniref:Uncharacterized protein n=1 Tax=Myxococcus fulvus TaxID=33 RepID=A0A511T7C2_MYXFU|nr:hypothetical protein MFU01_51070 [Myxococcus fulvus]
MVRMASRARGSDSPSVSKPSTSRAGPTPAVKFSASQEDTDAGRLSLSSRVMFRAVRYTTHEGNHVALGMA